MVDLTGAILIKSFGYWIGIIRGDKMDFDEILKLLRILQEDND